jgi:hypothetical protein
VFGHQTFVFNEIFVRKELFFISPQIFQGQVLIPWPPSPFYIGTSTGWYINEIIDICVISRSVRRIRRCPSVNRASMRSVHVVGACNLHRSAHLPASLPSAATRENAQRLANCSGWSCLKTRTFTQRYATLHNRCDCPARYEGYGSHTHLNVSYNRHRERKKMCKNN